ncbi:MAG TPA: peptidoglycan recognition protein, partial [Acidimicrobiia bacterium]|nr:peptidoglycan recognition protein [Acidimicrobiia bacterium]
WQGDPGAAFTVETRDEAGAWSPAGAIEATPADEGPDDGSIDARGRPGSNVSEALWVGDGVTGVRVRLDDGVAVDVDLHAVESPPAVAPEGVAVAAGGPIFSGGGAGPGSRLFVAVVTLAMAGLVVVGFRWRRFPRRGRRLATGLLLVASIGLGACVPPPAPAPAPAPVPGLDNLISRAGWGANENLRLANCPGGPDYMSAVKLAVVHHTVNSNSYSAGQGPQLVRGIYGYHTQSLGYCDIAYNFLVDRYGNVYEGRYGGTDRAVMGAHARGFNTASTGVALIGDFRTAVPPAEAIDALVQLLAWKLGVHGINPTVSFSYQTAGNEKWAPGTTVTLSPITYHAFTGHSECPGTQVINRMGQIATAVVARMGY